MQDLAINFCKRDMMSICAASNETQQKMCRFYKKSSYTDKCMYFVFGEYCDCLEAQINFQVAQPEFQEDAIDAWICPQCISGFENSIGRVTAHKIGRMMSRDNFALVLGGGAARGLYHIGVIKALDDAGIRPTLVVGTVMGAFIGAMYCC